MTKGKALGVAVVGCGRISYSHIQAIVSQPDLGRLVAVVDADSARAEAAAKVHGVPALATLDDALALDDVVSFDFAKIPR